MKRNKRPKILLNIHVPAFEEEESKTKDIVEHSCTSRTTATEFIDEFFAENSKQKGLKCFVYT